MAHGIDVADMHDSGDWSVIGYNLGLNPHTVDVTFLVHRAERKPKPFTLFDDADLSLFPTYEAIRHD